MKFNVIIPARYESTRLPGKMLVDIAGKPMLQHVYERALQSGAAQVVIATDHAQIAKAAHDFGAAVCMTSVTHRSGTERLAEAVTLLGYHPDDIIVNVQGDEPLIPPAIIRQAASDLISNSHASVSTLASRIHTVADVFNPNIVKVVLDKYGYALYFSRAAIPWDREHFAQQTLQHDYCYRHIGLYAYQVKSIINYINLAESPLETIESLEQLRLLWHGEKMHVGLVTELPPHGVDTFEDLAAVRALMLNSTA